MSVTSSFQVVLRGVPEGRVEPLTPVGYFTGRGSITGDATGGTVDTDVRVEERLCDRYLFIMDAMGADCGTADAGEGLAAFGLYVADDQPLEVVHQRLIGSHNTAHGRRYTRQELTPP